MSGFITKTEVEANAAWIVDNYGQEFYAACLNAEGTTFLSMLISWGLI